MTNYEIIKFRAIRQRLIDDYYEIVRQTLLAYKEIKKISGFRFLFFSLNWKLSSSNTFKVFFYCQKPSAHKISWRSGSNANV